MSGEHQKAINEAAVQMGRKGGRNGKGTSKLRGNVSYYRDMQRKSVASRLQNKNRQTTGRTMK